MTEHNFVTEYLTADSPEMAEVSALFATIPTREPACSGPTDEEFLSALEKASCLPMGVGAMPTMKSLDEILAARGITDAAEYLASANVPVGPSGCPDVYVRGDVHLMLGRTITRDEVDRRFAALKHV